MDSNTKFSKDEVEDTGRYSKTSRKTNLSETRPYITFAGGEVSHFMQNPK
jgi:hypothetical protein